MKTKLIALTLFSLLSFNLTQMAHAEGSTSSTPWMAHVRGLYIVPDNHSSPVSGLEASNVVIPELDFGYYFTPAWSVELILGTSRHDIKLNGTTLGKVSLLPPTLTAKYHFEAGAGITPYVGAGINHTLFFDDSLPTGLSVSTNSTGLALQVGADYQIGSNLYLNIDIKKVYIKTDVAQNGNYLTTFDINPMIYGLGVGMKF